MPDFITKKAIIGFGVLLFATLVFGLFSSGLQPASADVNAAPIVFEIKQGEGFRQIVNGLHDAHVIRSVLATETLALLSGEALKMRPGLYRLSPASPASVILDGVAGGNSKEVAVVIPEGVDIYRIDAILADALVIHHGDLVNFHDQGNLEGKLFPDTYRFFTGSDIKDVVQKFLDNFNAKAAPLLAKDEKNMMNNLILASIVQREVPDPIDEKIVAGILKKRLAAGMPLQVDATVCYAAEQKSPLLSVVCDPLDLKIDSPYNTYLYKGLPPGPVGNPGVSAISAAMSPQSSPCWFYLNDPKTGKTIFAKTLDEQHQNTVKYLKGN
jgi:UPF0755 protein